MMAELLSRMNIGQMNLNRRNADSRQGIAQSNAVMRQRPGIDDDAHRARAKRLNRVDQMPLVVGLHVLDTQRGVCAKRYVCQVCHDFGEGRPSVHAGLPRAEQVQVRSIENQDMVALDLSCSRLARHEWSIQATQLRTGSTMVMRRSSMI